MGNINIEIPDELHKQLKIAAALQGTTLKKLISSGLQKRLKRRGS